MRQNYVLSHKSLKYYVNFCLKKQIFAFCALLGVWKFFSSTKKSRKTCSQSFKIILCTWNAFEFSKNQLFAIDGFCFFLKWPKLAKIPFWDWNFQQNGRKIEISTNSTDWNFYFDPQQSLNHQKYIRSDNPTDNLLRLTRNLHHFALWPSL